MRKVRRLARRTESGQMAIVLVLGVTLILSLTSLLLTTTSAQHDSIINNVVLEKLSYRAVEAGIADVSYELNANFDLLSCNSSNTPGSFESSSTPSLASNSAGVLASCSSETPFNVWIPVADTGQAPFVPEFYLITNPTFAPPTYNPGSGTYNPSNTAETPVSVEIVGAAGRGADVIYQNTTAVFEASNQFLLNTYWTQFNDLDPDAYTKATGQPPPDCEHWDWQWNAAATDEHTNSNDYGTCDELINPWETGDTVHGPVFSDDSTYVEGTPVFFGPVTTADPYCQFVDPDSSASWSKSNCAGVNAVTPPGGSTFGASVESLPANNDSLEPIAAAQGCIYLGPTYITLNGPTASAPASMTVMGAGGGSPVVATSSRANQCRPSTPGASVPLPTDGVVYVADASDAGPCAAQPALPNEIEASEAPPGCLGDAIVNGSLYGDLTIAASNNIVIDGNITYCQDPAAPGAAPNCPSAPNPSDPVPVISGSGGSADTSSVLGMIANRYVELNNPHTSVTPPTSAQICGHAGAPPPPACVVGNVYIDAAILALNNSFIAPGLPSAGKVYTINVIGSVVEKYAASVSLEFNQAQIEFEIGYQTDFYWDPRLSVLSPPFFFESGQDGSAPNWSITSSSVSLATPCAGLQFPAPQNGSLQQGAVSCASIPPPG